MNCIVNYSDLSVRAITADDVPSVNVVLKSLDTAELVLADVQRALTAGRDIGEAFKNILK